MNYPLQTMLQMGLIPPVTFPTDSRYFASGVLTYVAPDGQQIPYLARRIVPQPSPANFTPIGRHTVHQGDRLDLIAAKYLGDPLLFWLLCDANGAIRPEDLLAQPGDVLQITTPIGVTGVTRA